MGLGVLGFNYNSRANCLQQECYKSDLVHSGLECARYDSVFGAEWEGSDRKI